MSDTTSQSDIQDVLASIRRLISENGGQMASVEIRQDNGRLVLGPAQRVDTAPATPVRHDEVSSSVDAAIAELEQAVTSGALQLLSSNPAPDSLDPAPAQEPQGARDSAHRLTLSDPEGHAEPERHQGRDQDAGRSAEPNAAHHFDPEDEADAALLREIVADLVRQELQGPLGQKITRSVRMLVHREVNRILAARGLE